MSRWSQRSRLAIACLNRSQRWPKKLASSPRFLTIHSMKLNLSSIGGAAFQS